jgi:regulator of replication initiation timing
LKVAITSFERELSDLKKQKTELSQQNTAAKLEVSRKSRGSETGKHSKSGKDWKELWPEIETLSCQVGTLETYSE